MSVSAITSRRRRVLVCVTGLSPQIVTETLYALSQLKAPWIPDVVYLLTTQRGADNARRMLLSEEPGWFKRLCQDYHLPAIEFGVQQIVVLRDAQGQPLEDIRDDADNHCAADGIANFLSEISQDTESEIHASIAGGRKTMGFFLGYAMSLWGRSQDRLSHVLVSAPFEGRPEFFYPTPRSQVLVGRVRGEDPVDAKDAKVWLGDIPFVRLRRLLPEPLLAGKGQASYTAAVAAANTALDHIELTIKREADSVLINGQPLRLPPMQYALLVVLAWRTFKQLPALVAPIKDVHDPDWKKQVLNDLESALGQMHIPDSVVNRLRDEEAIFATFSEQLSKLKRSLRESGLLPLRELVLTEQTGRGRQRAYRLQLLARQIRFM